jgi:predicted nucleotidyltransferase
MNRSDAIQKLLQHADTIRGMGVTALYLYGSTVRNEAQASSDLDLFIDYDPDKRLSLLDLVGIKQFLEEELCVEVDITTRSSLHPMLRTEIEQSAIWLDRRVSAERHAAVRQSRAAGRVEMEPVDGNRLKLDGCGPARGADRRLRVHWDAQRTEPVEPPYGDDPSQVLASPVSEKCPETGQTAECCISLIAHPLDGGGYVDQSQADRAGSISKER